MPNADSALPPGYALNEYQIESTLGVGGFGLTYLATDRNLNLRVALKEYMPGELVTRNADQSIRPKADDCRDTFDWGLRRFLDESRTLASFRHPNIVRVMRFFEANKTAYMVMEFVAGQPFNDWIKERRPLPEASVLGIVGPLLDGLELIHRGGYLHRDIKPSNIFIRDDGTPVLLDFGSARLANAEAELTAVVTPGYAPFEQSHSQGNQGPWSDLYAVGAVLYWIITGRRPIEAAARVRRDVMPSALETGDQSRYSADLLKATDWALAPNEENRPQTVAEFRRALQLASPPASAGNPATAMPTSFAHAAPATTPSVPVHSTPPTQLVCDADTLKKIAAELATHIGPIASIVVKTSAKKSSSIAQLTELAGAEIADAAARAAFVKKYANADKTIAPGNTTLQPQTRFAANPATTVAPAFDPATLARVESALAKHVGGVARVLVSRAAKRARDLQELCAALAEEIPNSDDKRAFLKSATAAPGERTERVDTPASSTLATHVLPKASSDATRAEQLSRAMPPTARTQVHVPTQQIRSAPSVGDDYDVPTRPITQSVIQAAVLFADVSGSTRLYEVAGDTVAATAIEQHLALLKRKTAAAGGRVIKTIGDEIMASFPTADAAASAAVDMQCGIAQLASVAGIKIGIRIGLNYGAVVERDGDVFGDAVNVAARLASQAQKDQIITSFETVGALSPILKMACRRLYSIQVKGKEQQVELWQISWQEADDATNLVRTPPSQQSRTATLRLRYREREVIVDSAKSSLTLGRDKSADLVVENPNATQVQVERRMASRVHCKIERRMDKFVIADHSGNGTYVTVDGDKEVVLLREEFTLRGHGWIALGQPRANTAELVEFFCES